MKLQGELQELITNELFGVYIIAEESREVLYINQALAAYGLDDCLGKPCYQAFFNRETPCDFCPNHLQDTAGMTYCWEYFDTVNHGLYQVKNRLIQQDGRWLRIGCITNMSDTMELSHIAMDYLALLKNISDMQLSMLHQPEDNIYQISLPFLAKQFSAKRAALVKASSQWENIFLYEATTGHYQAKHLNMPLEPLFSLAKQGATRQWRNTELNAEQQQCLAAILGEDSFQQVCTNSLQVGDTVYGVLLFDSEEAHLSLENQNILLDILKVYMENHLIRKQLFWDNSHDRATGLFNRGWYMQQVATVYPTAGSIGILYLDIDNLKAVNDMLGHLEGDELILRVGQALLAVSGNLKDRHPYRLGGDEFALVCLNCQEGDLAALAESFLLQLADLNTVQEGPNVEISYGWAYGGAGTDLTALLRQADRNMYRQKLSKRQQKK